MLAPITLCAVASLVPHDLGAQDPSPISFGLRVNRAIARGLDWLRKEQRKDGSWAGEETTHPRGVTAFVAYTLVKSGVSRGDPMLQAALANVAGAEFKSTYSAAVDLMLCEALNEPPSGAPSSGSSAHARASFDFLLASQRSGVWGYPADPLDMSNTQFALLGLRAGTKLGFEIPPKTIERCTAALLDWQDSSGGFGYRSDREPTSGMTAATLAGLAVLAELGKGLQPVESLFGKKRAEIRAAEAWLEDRFTAHQNAYGSSAWTPTFHHAHLWAIERYCGLAHKEKLGAHDWYREGAEFLVADQRADGGFGRAVPDVCFALLFLRRATVTSYEDLSAVYAAIDREKQAASEKPGVHPDATVPRISDWLVAGPFRDKRGAPFLLKPPFAPEKLAPREKQQLREHVFERWSLKPDAWTNLEELTGRDGDFLVWVLATSIVYKPATAGAKVVNEPDKRALDAVLWFAFEDAWKVYLDGKLVSADERVQAPVEETIRIDIHLEPGVHTLVVLASDDVGSSAFSARITDAAGHALPASVTTSADPNGKSKPPLKIEKK